MADDDKDKGDNTEENEEKKDEITLKVGDEDKTFTLDELKEMATKSLSADADKTFTLAIDGQDKTFTLDELKGLAQKSAGADYKFEKAAEARKAAEKGIRLQELMESIKGESPDQQKVKELLVEMGADPAEVDKQMKLATKGTADKKGSEATETKKTIAREDLPEDVQLILADAERSNLKGVRDKIEDACRKGVDGDTVLVKMIDRVAEGEPRDKTKKTLYDMVIDDVRGRILAREQYGPEMVRSSLQKVRARTESLGIPANAAAAGPVLPAGLAASIALTPEIQSSEPIKRVSSSDPNYEDNFMKRAQQKMVQAARSLGGRRS